MDPSILFPSFSPYHIAFVTRELEAGMTSFDRLYGHPEFTVMRHAEIQTPSGVAIIDFALADMNGLRIEVIQPCGVVQRFFRTFFESVVLDRILKLLPPASLG